MKPLISKDHQIQFTIRGTRIPAVMIKRQHFAGDSIELLRSAYNLTEEQVKAAINFKARVKV